MTTTDKIRKLLKQGKPASQIAKLLKIRPARVYTVKWLDAKKQKPSEIIEAVQEVDKDIGVLFSEAYERYQADPVNHPAHYKAGGIETIDFIEAKDLNYRLGNVIKYVTRAGRKSSDPIEDLQKAAWYLEREIVARKNA